MSSKDSVFQLESYYPNGTIKEKYSELDGKRQGPFIQYYQNGIKQKEGNYSNGKMNGVILYFREDGSLWEKAEFLEGERHGISRVYDKRGQLVLEEVYVHGEKSNSAEKKSIKPALPPLPPVDPKIGVAAFIDFLLVSLLYTTGGSLLSTAVESLLYNTGAGVHDPLNGSVLDPIAGSSLGDSDLQLWLYFMFGTVPRLGLLLVILLPSYVDLFRGASIGERIMGYTLVCESSSWRTRFIRWAVKYSPAFIILFSTDTQFLIVALLCYVSLQLYTIYRYKLFAHDYLVCGRLVKKGDSVSLKDQFSVKPSSTNSLKFNRIISLLVDLILVYEIPRVIAEVWMVVESLSRWIAPDYEILPAVRTFFILAAHLGGLGYSAIEALTPRSFGKYLTGLTIDFYSDHKRRALIIRWAIKYSWLILLVTLHLLDQFKLGELLVWENDALAYFATALLANLVFYFASGVSLHDRVAGTNVTFAAEGESPRTFLRDSAQI